MPGVNTLKLCPMRFKRRQQAAAAGKVGRLAKRVGMERTHLYRKLRSLGIDLRQSAPED